MNCKVGIIATSLLICSVAGTARAGLSETSAAGERTSQASSTPAARGGQAVITSLLDRFAGIGFSNPFSEESSNPSPAVATPISETTLFSAFTMTDSPMNAYYSRLGTDNSGTIAAISRSASFAGLADNPRFVLPEGGLAAAAIQGHFVGSGAVVGGATIAPMQGVAPSPSFVQTNNYIGGPDVPIGPTIPIPLPFLLSGSGLAMLFALRKQAGFF